MGTTGSRTKKLFTWLRNGISICFTWLTFLLLVRNFLYDIETVTTESLGKLFLCVCGGVLLFAILFSDAVIQKMTFTARLTGFMVLFSVYECAAFYWMEIFETRGSIKQWLIFAGIILGLYAVCILIYRQYSRKKGMLYTQALKEYQEKRKRV